MQSQYCNQANSLQARGKAQQADLYSLNDLALAK